MTQNERRLLIALGALGLVMVMGSIALAGALLVVARPSAPASTAQTTTAGPVTGVETAVTNILNEAKAKAAEAKAKANAAQVQAAAEARVKDELAGRRSLPLSESRDAQSVDLAELYEQVDPGVVSLEVSATIASPFGGQGIPQQGSGSGWLFDEQHIVTNNHVVSEAKTVEVVFYDGERREGRVVGSDVSSDLAVVAVDDMPATARPLPVVARFDDLKVGQPVVAIGNPFGLENTMTYGIISALGRVIPSQSRFSIPEVVQTDAPVNPGNSGGPLLNLQGEVVGVNAQITTANQSVTGTASNSGVAFAIPGSIIQKVVPVLISKGAYEWSYLGVTGNKIDLEIAKANNLPSTHGAYILQVLDDGPSAGQLKGATNLSTTVTTPDSSEDQAPGGMQIIPIPNPNQQQTQQYITPVGGDVVISVDGQTVNSFQDLLTYVALETVPGQTIELTVLRDGQEIKVPIQVGTRPTS